MSVSTTNVRVADPYAYGLIGSFRSTWVTSHPLTAVPDGVGTLEQPRWHDSRTSPVLLVTERRLNVLDSL
jgi:hypothetical protein